MAVQHSRRNNMPLYMAEMYAYQILRALTPRYSMDSPANPIPGAMVTLDNLNLAVYSCKAVHATSYL